MIRVVLADDQQLVRAGFTALLNAEDDMTVVGGTDDGASAVDLVRAERPDVVLMDVRMAGFDGIAATEQIVADPDPDPDLADVRVWGPSCSCSSSGSSRTSSHAARSARPH